MATVSAQMPHFEVVHRMLELPMVELAYNKSASTYSRFKDSHQLVNWALSTAESSLMNATRQAAPYAEKFKTPISFVDHTLCRGLDKIEMKVPIVKKSPDLILDNAFMLALETVQPAVSKIAYVNDLVTSQAATIKYMSWNKMNQILSTHYGSAAVEGLDFTAVVVETMIDKYFPPIGEEKFPESVSADEDKLLHSLQTLGRLSNKAARRVYVNVVHHLRTLSKDNLKAYLSSLVEFLQLASYVDALNERVHNLAGSPTKSTSQLSTENNKKEN